MDAIVVPGGRVKASLSIDEQPREPHAADEQLAELAEAVARHPLNREILYKILKHCQTERALREIEDYVAALPEFKESTQNQYYLVSILVKHGGLDAIERDEAGAVVTPMRKEGLTEDEIDDLVWETSYRATVTGERLVARHDPAARLAELFRLAPERTASYADVLAFVAQCPRSYAEIEGLLRGSPALETVIDGEPQTMQPSVFVDKLERAGALVWEDGWQLTKEGRGFLEDLRAGE